MSARILVYGKNRDRLERARLNYCEYASAMWNEEKKNKTTNRNVRI